MYNFEELIQIIKNEYSSQLTDRFRSFSFIHGEDGYVVVLSYKKKIQIIVFTQFGNKGFYCKASVMNHFNSVYITTHTIDRFMQRFTQSEKYSMLELLAKELLYLISDAQIEGWCQTRHGRFFVSPHPTAIVCRTFWRNSYVIKIHPDENWFIKI